jgi:NADPH:quinone reductase-like Zn-dependent oxidoreductase/acyl carrier protein
MECSGIVRRVGPGITRFKPGDKVVTFGIRWMMPLVHAPESWVQPMPQPLGFEEAATVPVAFVIAYHALKNLARLQPGESVLIHSACGGIGLAAIQIAQFLKAEVLTTAGSETKRNYLREMGIEYVSNSRTADFLTDTLAWTAGKGVDVILNSLAGELLDKGLEALAPRGRFIELGRRDFQENRRIGLQLFSKGVQFLPVVPDPQDMDFVSSWNHVGELLHSGKLKPLPYRVFGTSRIADAFEEMSCGEHIGKFIVVPDGKYPPVSFDVKARETGAVDEVIRSLVQGMTPAEGVTAFQRVLASGLPEVLVSTQDLKMMLKQQEIVSAGGHEAFWAAWKNASEAPIVQTRATIAATGHGNTDMGIEAELAAIWRDLLGVNEIAPDADFFDLGGDSLVAIRMVARMKEVFDVEQTLAGVFQYSTFRKMSDAIRTARTPLGTIES